MMMLMITNVSYRFFMVGDAFSQWRFKLINNIVIYEAFCFDVTQGRMNGAPHETRTHS